VPVDQQQSLAPPRPMTPVERVAGSRLELAPRDQPALLRRAVSTYYVIPSGTMRDLETRGWTLTDVLVAGNLAHRSEASLEEVIALKDAGQDWNTIADRIGVATSDVYQPTAIRRVVVVPSASYYERRAMESREHHGTTQERENQSTTQERGDQEK
jgi:hypothetical protein